MRQQSIYMAEYAPAKCTGSAGGSHVGGSYTGSGYTGNSYAGGSYTGSGYTGNSYAGGSYTGSGHTGNSYSGSGISGGGRTRNIRTGGAAVSPARRNTYAAAVPYSRQNGACTWQLRFSGRPEPTHGRRTSARTRRRKKRRHSLRLLIFTTACLCLALFGAASTHPTLPAAVSSIVFPLDLGGAWDADTETALRALAARRPEVQPMLDDPAAWPADVAALLARNEEALDFVLAYPSLAGTVPPGTVEEAQKGTFPTLLQWDARWGAASYAGSILALSGCGPTVLSVVTCGLTGNDAWTPAAIAEWAQGWGYATGSGTSWELMRSGCEHFGVKAEELSLSETAVIRALEAGSPIICSVRPGDFTTAGHFIVLTGTEDGLIRLVDPNSPMRSEMLWEWDRLMPQIKNLWAYTAL